MQRIQTRIHGEQQLSLVTYIDDDYSMGIDDTMVMCDGGSSTIALTLPPVAEAQGRIFSIRVTDGSNNTTVTANGDEVAATDGTNDFGSGVDLTAANDVALLYSDGLAWIPLHVVAT